MKYQISAHMIVNGALSDTGNRAAPAGGVVAAPFYVVNAGPAQTDYGMRQAIFGGSSNLRILEARAMPLLAAGLREGMYYSQSGEPAFRGNLYAPQSQNYNLFLTKFNEWQPADALFETEGEASLVLTLYSFSACYDAYKIKDDYKGKSFGFRLDLRVESSGGIIVP